MITSIPRTSDAFNAMFPYLHRLGFNLHSLGMQGALTGINQNGPQFDAKYIQQLGRNPKRIRSIFKTLKPLAVQDAKEWGIGMGGYAGITEEEAWMTGLFMGGAAGPKAGMAQAQAGVDMVKGNARATFRQILKENSVDNDLVRKAAVIKEVQMAIGNPAWLQGGINDPFAPQPPGGGGRMNPPGVPVARASGGPVGGINWSPQGTDTVPAMLTPGEYVMRKSAVDKYGTSFMNLINSGAGSKIRPTRGVQYRQDSGSITPTGGGGGGFGDIVSGISNALSAFSETFSLMNKLGTLLSDTISNMTGMEIKHTIHVDGSLKIPGFSQVNINSIVQAIGNDIADQTQKKIDAALALERGKRDKET